MSQKPGEKPLLIEEVSDETLPFPVTQSAKGPLRTARTGARMRDCSGRFDQRRTPQARVPCTQPIRPCPCAHRWRSYAMGIARDLGLPWREDRKDVARIGCRTGRRA